MTGVIVILGVSLGIGLVARDLGKAQYAILAVAAIAVTVYELFGGHS